MGGYSQECSTCGKWFIRQQGFRDHLKTHLKFYACEINTNSAGNIQLVLHRRFPKQVYGTHRVQYTPYTIGM